MRRFYSSGLAADMFSCWLNKKQLLSPLNNWTVSLSETWWFCRSVVVSVEVLKWDGGSVGIALSEGGEWVGCLFCFKMAAWLVAHRRTVYKRKTCIDWYFGPFVDAAGSALVFSVSSHSWSSTRESLWVEEDVSLWASRADDGKCQHQWFAIDCDLLENMSLTKSHLETLNLKKEQALGFHRWSLWSFLFFYFLHAFPHWLKWVEHH